MSVINQMLRDLDRQQHAPGNLPGEVQPVPPAAGAWGRWAALAGLMLLAGSLGFALREVFAPVAAPASDAVPAPSPSPSGAAAERGPFERNAVRSGLRSSPLSPPASGEGKERGVSPAAPNVPVRIEAAPVPASEPAVAEPLPVQVEPKADAPAEAEESLAEPAAPEAVQPDVEAAPEPLAIEPAPAPAPQLRKTPAQREAPLRQRLAQAVLYLQQGRAAEAEALLSPLLAEQPESPETRLMLARARLGLGRADEARALLAEREPPLAGHAGYHAVLAALEQQLGAHAAAAARYGALVRLDERQAAWWLGLGLALDGLGRRDEALPAYRRALDLNQLAGPAREHAAARVAGGR